MHPNAVGEGGLVVDQLLVDIGHGLGALVWVLTTQELPSTLYHGPEAPAWPDIIIMAHQVGRS